VKHRFSLVFSLTIGMWSLASVAGPIGLAQLASAQAPAAGGAARAAQPPAYPDRPKAPQEVLDRGKATFGVNCAFCHGSDAGGGEAGPNLWRSSVVLQDKAGELIAPIVHGGRVDKGMPRIDITDPQVADIAAWLHSIHVSSRSLADASINIVTGNAADGHAAFQKTCASCHSVTGDLKGIASKVPDPKVLQMNWLIPGGAGRGGAGRGAANPIQAPPVTVTVTLPSGEKVTGKLDRIDDFTVGLTTADGTSRSFERMGNKPQVDIHDPLAPHRALLHTYSEKDMHDITAYLVTIK
jgi:cytochrome c oxidase cbb3-type subunit 3